MSSTHRISRPAGHARVVFRTCSDSSQLCTELPSDRFRRRTRLSADWIELIISCRAPTFTAHHLQGHHKRESDIMITRISGANRPLRRGDILLECVSSAPSTRPQPFPIRNQRSFALVEVDSVRAICLSVANTTLRIICALHNVRSACV
jgi:hypothetical protein